MALEQQIQEDIKAAMKAHDAVATAATRAIKHDLFILLFIWLINKLLQFSGPVPDNHVVDLRYDSEPAGILTFCL